MKYLYFSLIFIPISLVVNKFVSNILISCMLQVMLCGIVYLIELVLTKDKIFIELSSKVLKKVKIIK